MHKFIGFAAIVAVLNPLCCCFAGVVPVQESEAATSRACCAKQETGAKPSQDGADTAGCAHEDGAYQKEIPTDAAVAAAPTLAVIGEICAETYLDASGTAMACRDQDDHGPPGRHDPPAWLRSHSFLN